jgi:hypothetical protein
MEESAYLAATEHAPSTFVEMIRFWHKRVDVQTLCAFCERLSKYVGTTQCEIDERDGSYTVTLEHELGMKYSLHLKRVCEQGIRETLKVESKIQTTSNSVFIQFSQRSPKVAWIQKEGNEKLAGG